MGPSPSMAVEGEARSRLRRRGCYSPQLAGGAIGANVRRLALGLKGQNVIRLRTRHRKIAIEDQRPLEAPKGSLLGSFDDRNAKPVDCRGEEGGGAKNHADHSSRRGYRRLDAPHHSNLARPIGASEAGARLAQIFLHIVCAGPRGLSGRKRRLRRSPRLIAALCRFENGDDHGRAPMSHPAACRGGVESTPADDTRYAPRPETRVKSKRCSFLQDQSRR